MLVRVLQGNRTNTRYVCVYLYKERQTEGQTYSKELAYEILKAKSHDPRSASLQPGKSSDAVLAQFQRPEKRESRWCSSKPEVVKQEKGSCPQVVRDGEPICDLR